jgi:hypothetical protein
MELNGNEKELLFAWMRRLETKVDGLRDGMHSVERRVVSLEQQVAGMRADINHQREQFVAAHA